VATVTFGGCETSGGTGIRQGGGVMADLMYVGVTVAFFWLSWLLADLCERL
jgi:hypothetical protein